MAYWGIPIEDIEPYIEGAPPMPKKIHVQGTDPPIMLPGFNFSGETLRHGEPVLFVLDMFQRWGYSKGSDRSGERIVSAQRGQIEEPVVSSPYRDYPPNFVGTNQEGVFMQKAIRDANPFYLHHLSSGTVRLAGKKYAPIQSTYHGGEEYIGANGAIAYRLRGELRYSREGEPFYLLGRRVSKDHRFFALHQDFFLAQNRSGQNAYLNELRSDSPFLAEYQDGRECHFDIKPIPLSGAFPEEWELTTDFTQAQNNSDFCVVPEAADGECFVKGEELCFRRKVSFAKVPVYDAFGNIIEGEWQWAGYTYYEAVPYPEYLEPLRGQGKTEGFYHKTLPDRIEISDVRSMGNPNTVEYVRLKLTGDIGLPSLHNEEKVCRLCEFAPSRGVFYKVDSDSIRYPVIVTPETSDGYGIPTATAHHAYDEATHKCTDIVEYKRHRMVRRGSELLLTAENECWRQCGKIEGTIPPDLGDPRVIPKRVVFVETRPQVTGRMPDITSLMSGSFCNLATGEVTAYSDYKSSLPLYPDELSAGVMWNPGGLNCPDYEFMGFATYPDAPEPLFMISGDIPIGTLFPVWHPPDSPNATRVHTVTFSAAGSAAHKFYGTLPKSLTLKYGSELDVMGYGDETMRAYGLHFAGWSTDPNFQTVIPRVVVSQDITLYAVWYTAKIPYNKPKVHSVQFGDGMFISVNRSSVIRLKDFNPDGLSHPRYRMIGWNTVPNSRTSLLHLSVREDTFLYPVWVYNQSESE